MQDLFKENGGLKNNLQFDDFEIIKSISEGSFGDVFLAKNNSTGDDLYAIKTVRFRAKESDQDIKTEIAILEKIHSSNLKPKSIPSYFGSHKEVNKFKQIQYNLIFEFLPKTLKSLIDETKTSKAPVPFQVMKVILNLLSMVWAIFKQ